MYHKFFFAEIQKLDIIIIDSGLIKLMVVSDCITENAHDKTYCSRDLMIEIVATYFPVVFIRNINDDDAHN